MSRANPQEMKIIMVITRCLPLPAYRGHTAVRCFWLGRIVIVVLVLVVAVVLAVQGYPPEEIAGPMLVLVAGTIAAAERLVRVGDVPPAAGLSTL